MIFIKNKKAWKDWLKDSPYAVLSFDKPKSYPFYLEVIKSQGDLYCDIYKSDLQSMIDKIDSGREF